jgi:hypothetical protein
MAVGKKRAVTSVADKKPITKTAASKRPGTAKSAGSKGEVWIARDADRSLWLYLGAPKIQPGGLWGIHANCVGLSQLNAELFPSVLPG